MRNVSNDWGEAWRVKRNWKVKKREKPRTHRESFPERSPSDGFGDSATLLMFINTRNPAAIRRIA
jgi:hypothetical protein